MKSAVRHTVNALRFCIAIVLALTTAACIHTYPTPEGGNDPTEIALVINIKFEEDWGDIDAPLETDHPLNVEGSGITTRNEDWPRRIIAIITDNTGKSITKTFTCEPEEISGNIISIPFASDLHANLYHVAVWADYLDSSTHAPLAYDATKLPYITELARLEKDKQKNDTNSRNCLYGSADIDLRSLAGSWNETYHTEIELTPPVSRFQLLAEDYAEFLEYTKEARDHGEKYKVKTTYKSEIPLSFNILEGAPMEPLEDCSFDNDLHIITIPVAEMPVSYDWLFNPSYRIYHTVSLTVINSALVAVAHIDNITFPTEAGKITKVKGKFLTNFITGGVQIDNIWGGEITIELE